MKSSEDTEVVFRIKDMSLVKILKSLAPKQFSSHRAAVRFEFDKATMPICPSVGTFVCTCRSVTCNF